MKRAGLACWWMSYEEDEGVGGLSGVVRWTGYVGVLDRVGQRVEKR